MIYTLVKLVSKLFFRFWGNSLIVGLENIPHKGPIVVVANHSSLLDGFLLVSFWPQRITFLSSAYLFKLPLVGGFLHSVGAIPVQNGGNNLTGIRKALQVLKHGNTLALFPEGRIYQEDNLGLFHLGWTHFALKSGASVVPVVINGTRSVLPLGAVFPRRRQIFVKIAVPWTMEKTICPNQDTLLAMNTRLHEQMDDTLRGMSDI